jgi:hypothetical protein
VLRFATEVEPLFNNLRDATKENRSQAQKFIETLKPIGGTAIDDALKKAGALRPENGTRPYVIVFLTDGRPTVGNINDEQIVESATKSKTGLTRIFCFGIGTDVNTHLLDNIAEETKAFSTYVLPEEDIEVKVSSFFTKIKEPVLASPTIKFPDSVRVTKTYPSAIPDLFKGEQLLVAGRYSGSGDGAIQIEGNVSGDMKKFAYDVKFPGESSEQDFIPRLWATRRVGYLLDEIRLRGESKELKEEVTELARKYGIVTPFTAYLILEDEQRRNVPLSVQTLQKREAGQLSSDSDRFYRISKDKSGDGAVADARSFQMLKAAEAPSSAINSGNVETFRYEALSTAQAARGFGGVARSKGAGSSPQSAQTGSQARALEQQSRFVGGKTFYQNGTKWIDSDVQKQTQAKRVRVQFGSLEYFDLLAKQPQAKSWLALGTNVEFTVGDIVYEVAD